MCPRRQRQCTRDPLVALATAFFVMRPDEVFAFCEKRPELKVVLVEGVSRSSSRVKVTTLNFDESEIEVFECFSTATQVPRSLGWPIFLYQYLTEGAPRNQRKMVAVHACTDIIFDGARNKREARNWCTRVSCTGKRACFRFPDLDSLRAPIF